jgi:hypothetical protein
MIRLLFFSAVALLIPVLIIIGLQEYILFTHEPRVVRCDGGEGQNTDDE